MSRGVSSTNQHLFLTPSHRHERAFTLGVRRPDRPARHAPRAGPALLLDAAYNGGDACTSSARAHGVAARSPGAAPEEEETTRTGTTAVDQLAAPGRQRLCVYGGSNRLAPGGRHPGAAWLTNAGRAPLR